MKSAIGPTQSKRTRKTDALRPPGGLSLSIALLLGSASHASLLCRGSHTRSAQLPLAGPKGLDKTLRRRLRATCRTASCSQPCARSAMPAQRSALYQCKYGRSPSLSWQCPDISRAQLSCTDLD